MEPRLSGLNSGGSTPTSQGPVAHLANLGGVAAEFLNWTSPRYTGAPSVDHNVETARGDGEPDPQVVFTGMWHGCPWPVHPSQCPSFGLSGPFLPEKGITRRATSLALPSVWVRL